MATVAFTTYELVDTVVLEYLLQSIELIKWDKKESEKEGIDALKRYMVLPNLTLFKDCVTNGKIKVEYSLDSYGRYKNSNTINGYSYTNMFGAIRNLLCNRYYVDVDIKNCHPVIIYNLCLKYKIEECIMLKKFIYEREDLLKYIVDNNPEGHMNEDRIEGPVMNRDVAKRFTLMFFFGASLNKKMVEFGIDDLPEWFNCFYMELQIIIKKINNLECYKPIVEYVTNKKGNDYSNIRGSIFSHIIQNEERKLFDILKFTLESKGYELGAYIYDGCHVRRSKKKLTAPILRKFSEKLTEYFEIENPIPIELVIKDMEIHNKYLEVSNGFKLYQFYKKQMVDDNIFKINSPLCFHDGRAKTSSCDLPLVSEEKIIKSYRNKGVVEFGYNKPKKFIDVWLDDKFIKSYDKMVFCPNPNSPNFNKSNILNNFEGFEINKYEFNNLPKTQEERKIKCKVLFDYIYKLCNNNVEDITFITNYIASLLSKPWVKTGVMPVFTGKQGQGKTSLYLLLRVIIGDKYCYQTPSLENNIFGKHACGRKDKLLILLDEVCPAESNKYKGLMLTAITSDTMSLEPKGINPFEYDSYENYMGASNNEVPIEVSDSNRRFKMYDTDCCNWGSIDQKEQFFNSLYAIIGSRDIEPDYEILRCFYDYMINVDINNYNFEKYVNGEATVKIIKKPILEEFLNDNLYELYNKNTNYLKEEELKVSGNDLYDLFIKYCERMKLKFLMTGHMFGISIKKYKFLNFNRTNKGIVYIFNIKSYCEFFNYKVTEEPVEIDM